MSRDVAKIFAAIDSLDPEQFVAHLTPDVTFRFGNPEAIHGRDAVAAAVGGFYSTIGGMKHHIKNVWEIDDTVIVQIDVEYTRQDGNTVITPRTSWSSTVTWCATGRSTSTSPRSTPEPSR